MGEKLEEYMDNAGNTVRDDDIVVYGGGEYRVAYISHLYVNLDGGRGNWLHLPFHVGVPERKISNAPKAPPPTQPSADGDDDAQGDRAGGVWRCMGR